MPPFILNPSSRIPEAEPPPPPLLPPNSQGRSISTSPSTSISSLPSSRLAGGKQTTPSTLVQSSTSLSIDNLTPEVQEPMGLALLPRRHDTWASRPRRSTPMPMSPQRAAGLVLLSSAQNGRAAEGVPPRQIQPLLLPHQPMASLPKSSE